MCVHIMIVQGFYQTTFIVKNRRITFYTCNTKRTLFFCFEIQFGQHTFVKLNNTTVLFQLDSTISRTTIILSYLLLVLSRLFEYAPEDISA